MTFNNDGAQFSGAAADDIEPTFRAVQSERKLLRDWNIYMERARAILDPRKRLPDMCSAAARRWWRQRMAGNESAAIKSSVDGVVS